MWQGSAVFNLLNVRENEMKKYIRYLALPLALLTSLVLTGCAAVGTSIKHHDLNVQTKMSNTIFLQPQTNAQKTVYVAVHNTSDHELSEVQPMLIKAIQAKGYHVVTDPAQASYILQANILQIGEVSRTAAEQMTGGSFGSTLAGGAVGATTGAVLTNKVGGALVGGLVGGAASTIANNMVKDVVYTMVTDMQLQQRLPEGAVAHTNSRTAVAQGSSTIERTEISKTSNFATYRTRVVSMADKVNLKFDQAKPALEQQLAHALAGVL